MRRVWTGTDALRLYRLYIQLRQFLAFMVLQKHNGKEEPIGKLMDVLSEGVLLASLDYPAAATNQHSFLSFLMSLNELQPISAESDAEAM